MHVTYIASQQPTNKSVGGGEVPADGEDKEFIFYSIWGYRIEDYF